MKTEKFKTQEMVNALTGELITWPKYKYTPGALIRDIVSAYIYGGREVYTKPEFELHMGVVYSVVKDMDKSGI